MKGPHTPDLAPQGVRQRTSASVIDPLLRHRNGVGVGVFLGVVRRVERGYLMHSDTTALEDAHECFGSPPIAVRLVRLRLDHPPL